MPPVRAQVRWTIVSVLAALIAAAGAISSGRSVSMAGAAAPATAGPRQCAVQGLRLAPGTIRSAAHGALSVGLTVRNASRSSCRLARLPQTTSIVEDAGGRVFATAMTGRLYAVNPTAGGSSAGRSELRRSTVVLGPGGRARAHVVWADWCGGGVRQWGIQLRFGGQRRALFALVISNVAPGSMGSVIPPVPSCHHGARSVVTITPLARPRTA